MFLWVQVCFNKDVDLALPRPVRVNDLSAKRVDIGVVQLVVCLFKSGSLFWTGMKRWIKIWFLCWWEHLDDLLGRSERVNVYCPDLCHLAG